MAEEKAFSGIDIPAFKERLRRFARETYNMGHNYFEHYVGLNPGTISQIKVNGPSAANVMKIAIKCPELNLNWLFRGEGPMLLTQEEQAQPEPGAPVQAASSCYVNEAKAVFITNWDGMKDALRDVLAEINK